MASSKVLVTGARGFVGGHLVAALHELGVAEDDDEDAEAAQEIDELELAARLDARQLWLQRLALRTPDGGLVLVGEFGVHRIGPTATNSGDTP